LADVPGWTVDVGVAARVRPAHIGSSQYVTEAVPIFEAQIGDDITISLDDGAKWRALRLGPLAFGPIAEYRESFDDKLPSGSYRIRDAVELGGFAEWRTPVGLADIRLRRAVNSYEGWSGDLSFSTGAPVSDKLTLGGQVRLSWADENFSEEYFGLRPDPAHGLHLPRFQDNDFATIGAEFDAARQITPRTRLVLSLTADRIISYLHASPLLATRNIYSASLGITRRWSASAKGHNP
jgi:outer membrane scaffolding protein for murein synthesis (MipA/OmpV family)